MNFIDILMAYYRVVRENEMSKAHSREITLEKFLGSHCQAFVSYLMQVIALL